MNAFSARARQILRWLRGPEATAAETLALLVGALLFALGLGLGMLMFWGRQLSISGDASLGLHTAYGSALAALGAFALGRWSARPTTDDPAQLRDGFAVPGDRLRWYDLAAIAFAHAAIAVLGWLGIAELLEQSFIGAPVYAFPGAILFGVALALTGYIVFLSASGLTPMSLSLVLAAFLVVGAFASMLDSSDPDWWRDNLSALGMSSNSAATAFNVTLIIAGVIVTTISRYATAGLPADTRETRRGRHLVRGGLILMGLLLAAVGLFPVDDFFLLHNTVATGMAVAYAVVVVGLPWFLPGVSRAFVGFGWIYVLIIVMLGIFFATGYYNLTAVELIAAVLIFSWIIVFLRISGSALDPARGDAGDEHSLRDEEHQQRRQ